MRSVYLVDELVPVFLVLFKEVKMLRWCGPRVNQGEQVIGQCQAPTMELLRENSQQPQQVDYICKKDPMADV